MDVVNKTNILDRNTQKLPVIKTFTNANYVCKYFIQLIKKNKSKNILEKHGNKIQHMKRTKYNNTKK